MSSMLVLESGRFRTIATLFCAVWLACGVEARADAETTQDPSSSAEVGATSGNQVDRVAAMDLESDERASNDYDPWAAVSNDAVSPNSVATDSEASETLEPMSVDLVAATRIMAVEAEAASDGTIVRLMANGLIGNAVTFTLDDPARLVVDLPGLESVVTKASVELGSNEAARVRVGQHADKVRIVVDGGSSETPFDGRRVVPVSSGLVIALGRGEGIDQALAQATAISAPQLASTPLKATEYVEPTVEAAIEEVEPTVEAAIEEVEPVIEAAMTSETDSATDEVAVVESEPAAAEAATAEPVAAIVPVAEAAAAGSVSMQPVDVEPMPVSVASIYGIEFDSQPTRDRIVIMGDAPLDYLVFEPEPATLIVTLRDARIDPEAAVRIMPERPGPVSLISAFDQPELDTPEVRIVVQRAPDLEPKIVRMGSLLIVDFPRNGEIAAAPPVIEPVGGAMLAAIEDEAGSTASIMPIRADSERMPLDGAMANADDMMPADLEPGAAIDILNQGGLTSGKVYAGRRISLDFKDVDISDVLRLIAEVSELNVIAGDEVKGNVTIRLIDVPWDQALDVVLLTKGLGFMRIGNVLRIAPQAVIAQEEEMRLQERRAKEKLEDLIVKLQPVNYADVSEVSGMVGQLLSPRGSVNTDKRTNTLIMKDIPSVIDEATALIKAIDTQTPQVLIEAKIVEASLDFSREFGAQWGLGAQPLVDAFDGSSATRQDMGGSDLTFHNSDNSNFFGNNAVFSNPITANPTGLFNMAAFLLDQKLNLELQLQAAEVSGDGKVISSPRVVTLDNSKASIEQGVSIPFQTFENGDAQLEFVDAVLKLEVTPHITADKSIIMKITVNRNAPDTSVFTLTGSPAIAKNQVNTETLVKDGQTLVLGGIYVIDKSDRESRVPYLHSIPLIGAAFRSKEHSELRKELLIFVTPRVVQVPGSDA